MPGNRPKTGDGFVRFWLLAHSADGEVRDVGETPSTFGAFDSSEDEPEPKPDWTAIAERASDPWSH